MIARHLTDHEIQLYALGMTADKLMIVEHIGLCEECQTKVDIFQLMITGIQQQQTPAFDFNLSESVLAQLPPPKKKLSIYNVINYLLVLIGILTTAAAVYIFRTYISGIFAGITSLVMYLILITVISLLSALSGEMYITYKKKMATLDHY